MKANEYIYLVESNVYTKDKFKKEEDIDFLLKLRDTKDDKSTQTLINKKSDDVYIINFVGEVVTPNGVYFSLPKNMKEDENNVILIKKCLDKYLVDKNGNRLVFGQPGNFTSERLYFDQLKNYFLDYITYEFIYPLKKVKIHSNSPISGGKISVLDTIRNRDRFGTGITYNTKDTVNNDDWIIDDIYYYTLDDIMSRLSVSDSERKEIIRMKDYLKDEGYIINKLENGIIYSKQNKKLLDLSDHQDVVDKLKKCEVGIIHNPIKNILLEYYTEKKKADISKIRVKVFFTSNFERVWEMIMRDVLEIPNEKLCNDFRSDLGEKFKGREDRPRPISVDDVEKYKDEYPLDDKSGNKWMEFRRGRYWICEKSRDLIPDIFVKLEDGRCFIGDAKYYKDVDVNFDKEFYIYNRSIDNKYPMVIFAIPDKYNLKNTTVPIPGGYRRDFDEVSNSYLELIVITVSVEDAINDVTNNKRKVLDDSINLINKYTMRWEEQ
jgi:hypothetical protein